MANHVVEIADTLAEFCCQTQNDKYLSVCWEDKKMHGLSASTWANVMNNPQQNFTLLVCSFFVSLMWKLSQWLNKWLNYLHYHARGFYVNVMHYSIGDYCLWLYTQMWESKVTIMEKCIHTILVYKLADNNWWIISVNMWNINCFCCPIV